MKKVTIDKPVSELIPLELKCSDTKCEEGFHFFTSTAKRKTGSVGDCKSCGDASIDWDRIHRRDLSDIKYTIGSLKGELMRYVCWVNELDADAAIYATERGKGMILKRAKEIITKKIAKIPTGHFDYMCTPKKGKEIINYAQHATATCCRKCLERWHDIPQDIVLNNNQIDFCVSMIEVYINYRLPNLSA